MKQYLYLLSTIPSVVTGFSPIHHHRGTAWVTRKAPTVGITQLFVIDEKAVSDSVQILQKSIVEKPTVVNVLTADKVVTKAVSAPPPPPAAVETTTLLPPPAAVADVVVTVPPETASVSVPDVSSVVVPTTTAAPEAAISLPSVDLPSVDLPDPSALLDSLPFGDFPIIAVVGVVLIAVIAAVLSSGKSGDEPTNPEPASSPVAAAAPAAVSSNSGTVDLSVPYDAAARIAYDEWRAANNKGSFDATKFATFQTNYELVTVANVSAKDKARKAGVAPTLQSLGADADSKIVTLSAVA